MAKIFERAENMGDRPTRSEVALGHARSYACKTGKYRAIDVDTTALKPHLWQ
jgi:hypothetical protein